MRKALTLGAAAIGAALLTGCATRTGTGEPRATFGFGAPDLTMSGPAELLGWYDFERVDLVRLIDPDGVRVNAACGTQEVRDRDRGRCELDAAFRQFAAQGDNAELIRRRDAIQDRLMAASEQRCYAYRLQLTRNVSNTNFLLGSATSLFAGAGAAFTDPSTVRALAAAAGITNGVNAEYQRSYLHTLTLQLITRGIEIRRHTIRNEIETLRGSPLVYAQPFRYNPAADPAAQGAATAAANTATSPSAAVDSQPRSITDYSLERAIGDALRYHGACTVLSGLEEANKQVENAQSPSLETVNASMQTMLSIIERSRLIGDALDRAAEPSNNDPAN